MQEETQRSHEIPLSTDSSPDAVLELLFKLKVKDVMSATTFTASSKDTFRAIQQIMKEKHISGVPIIEKDFFPENSTSKSSLHSTCFQSM